MTGKKWLVDSDVLDRHDALLARKVDNPIDQQEGKAVREDLAYLVNVERYLRGSFGYGLSSFGHASGRQVL